MKHVLLSVGVLGLFLFSSPARAGSTVRSLSCRQREGVSPALPATLQIERLGPAGARAPYAVQIQGDLTALSRQLSSVMPSFRGILRGIRFHIPDADMRCGHAAGDPLLGTCAVPPGTEIELVPSDPAQASIRGPGRALLSVERVTRRYVHDIAVGQVVTENVMELRLRLSMRPCSSQLDAVVQIEFPDCLAVP